MPDPKFTPAALKALLDGDIENAIVASIPGGIEAQEARGQSNFVQSETLPIKMEGHRKLLESWDVRFGSPDQDGLFIQATLPKGWQKVPTEHSMWSILLDEQARQRARVFYKAAFYDRKADMYLKSRISIEPIYPDRAQAEPRVYSAKVVADRRGVDPDRGFASCTVLFKSAEYNEASFENKFQAMNEAKKEAIAWADKHFPEWQDPSAYWNEEIK